MNFQIKRFGKVIIFWKAKQFVISLKCNNYPQAPQVMNVTNAHLGINITAALFL